MWRRYTNRLYLYFFTFKTQERIAPSKSKSYNIHSTVMIHVGYVCMETSMAPTLFLQRNKEFGRFHEFGDRCVISLRFWRFLSVKQVKFLRSLFDVTARPASVHIRADERRKDDGERAGRTRRRGRRPRRARDGGALPLSAHTMH